MMGLYQRVPLLTVRIGCHLDAHQRGLPQVQSLPLRLHALLELLQRIPLRLQLHLLNRQARPAIHHLHRLRQLLPQHRRTQDVVTIDHRLQRCNQLLQPLLRGHRQQRRRA